MSKNRSTRQLDKPMKSTLFCYECEYHDVAHGNWARIDDTRNQYYLCPRCGTEITARPSQFNQTVPFNPVTIWKMAYDSARSWTTPWM